MGVLVSDPGCDPCCDPALHFDTQYHALRTCQDNTHVCVLSYYSYSGKPLTEMEVL